MASATKRKLNLAEMNTFSERFQMHVIQVPIELYYCESAVTDTPAVHGYTISIGYQFHVIGHTHLHLFNYIVREELRCSLAVDRLLMCTPTAYIGDGLPESWNFYIYSSYKIFAK